MNCFRPFSVVVAAALIVAATFSNIATAADAAKPTDAAKPSLKALIIDGQNNHAWQKTTPLIQAALETSGLFAVEVATSPAKGQDMSGFAPKFSDFDVIVSNYNGDAWPEATQKSFIDYVKNGGGLVIVHAANNSFGNWKEYNEMIGLGGWGGRNEKSGPYVYLKDEKWVRDDSPGNGGHHGPQHPFEIIVRDTKHPITAGMPKAWLHVQDELYDKLRGPAENMTVLATAFADSSKGGTGRHEPMIFTIDYGKGRVFHTPMGHSDAAMRCVGFIVTLQRGTEWAATGKVTQTKLPEDFPTAEKTSSRN